MPGVRHCSIDGCRRTRIARGWCHAHYKRWQETGDVQADIPIRERITGVCLVDGCDRPRHRRDWCHSHYERWRKGRDIKADIPIMTRRESAACATAALEVPVGTTRINGSGYIVRKLRDDDPFIEMASQSHGRWILEHRYVMAQAIGRPLDPMETVHHINGVRIDNRLENLELWQSKHPKGRRHSDPHCTTCTCVEAA